MKIHLPAALILLFLSVPLNAQDEAGLTSWISTDGRKVQASFIRMDGDAVVLMINGSPVSVPLTRLSPASQAYAKRFAAGSPPAAEIPPDMARLGSLVFPMLKFSNATVEEAMAFFAAKSRDLDPQHQGLVIRAHAAVLAAGEKISLDLANVTLASALRCLAAVAKLDMTTKAGGLYLSQSGANRPLLLQDRPSQRVSKLGSLVFPIVFFEEATLEEAAEYFRVKSRDLNPAGEQMPIILMPLPEGAAYDRITLDLRNVPLEKALRNAADLAGAEVICLGDVLCLQPKTPPPVTVVAAPPLSPPPPPSSPSGLPPELGLLDSQFQKQVAETVTAPFEADVVQLNDSYLTILDGEMAKYPYARQVLLAERKLVTDKQPIPAIDDKQTNQVLKSVRLAYHSNYARLEADRAKNIKPLTDHMVTQLMELESSLTKKNRVDDAKAVRDYREALAQSRPAAPAKDMAKIRRFVEDVVFGKERGSMRWLEAPRLVLHSSDPELKAFVVAAYDEICKEAKLSTPGPLELSVYIGSSVELGKMDSIKKRLSGQTEHSWWYQGDHDWNLKYADVILCSDRLSGAAAKNTLLKDMLRGFGLIGESREFEESCLSTKITQRTELSELDRQLIRFQYGHLASGTRKADLRKMVDAYWNQ